MKTPAKDMFGNPGGEARLVPPPAPPGAADSAPAASVAPGPQVRTVTLDVGGIACDLRTLDSSDRSVEANVLLQEIVLHSEWLARVRARFFLDTPGRRDRVVQFECATAALLLQGGCSADAAPRLAAAVAALFSEQLPGGSADLPEAPNTVVFERLARVMEARRTAVGKLLKELLVRAEDREQERLDEILNRVRDEQTLARILDAVVG